MGRPYIITSVVTWNNYDDTSACLDSLLELSYPNHDILLVDNGSTDRSVDKLRAEYPSVELIQTGKNLGYAGGMNVGTREALDKGADYIWQLNNDLVMPYDTLLSDLVETMEANPDIGMLTPLVKEYPDTDTVWFQQGVINWKTGNTDHIDSAQPDSDGLIYNDYIPNCSLLFPARVLDEVGVLPEDYFLYYDDVEHAIRIKDAGYKLVTDTTAEIYHKESKSSKGELGPMYSYYRSRNMILFGQKFQERVSEFFTLYALVWLVEQIGIRAFYRKPAGIRGLVEGMVDGFRQKRGRGRYP